MGDSVPVAVSKGDDDFPFVVIESDNESSIGLK